MSDDYYTLERILKRSGYSLWKTGDYTIDITKNESGTWDEYWDFKITFTLNKDTRLIETWEIRTDGIKHIEEEIRVITRVITETLETNKHITFHDLCLQIVS